jgi:hypothetical protein
MSYATINGLNVIQARLQLPRTGNWVADVIVDTATAAQLGPGTSASLSLGEDELTFAGTVLRGAPFVELVCLRLLGGSGGLGRDLTPRFYTGSPVSKVLGDMLTDGGEDLSMSSDPAAIGVNLPFWVTCRQAICSGLTNLATAAGSETVWRVLSDGSVFFGVDTYPLSALTEFDLIDYFPQENIQIIAAELPDVFPGESFNGKNVSTVEHYIDSKSNRATIWYDP